MPKFCSTCGKPVQFENAEICPNCGVRIQIPTAENITKNPITKQSPLDSVEKDKHYRMDLLAIGIAFFYFISVLITKFSNEILSFVAFILFIVGIISIIRRQIFNR